MMDIDYEIGIMVVTYFLIWILIIIFLMVKITNGRIINMKISTSAAPPPAGFTEDYETGSTPWGWDSIVNPQATGTNRASHWTTDTDWSLSPTHSAKVDGYGADSLSVCRKDVGGRPTSIKVGFKNDSSTNYRLGIAFGATPSGDNDYEGGYGFNYTRWDATVYRGGFDSNGNMGTTWVAGETLTDEATYYLEMTISDNGDGTSNLAGYLKNSGGATLESWTLNNQDHTGWSNEASLYYYTYTPTTSGVRVDDFIVTM